VGRSETTISVNATAPSVDSTESSFGTVADRQNVNSLPLNGRNSTDLALHTPGGTNDDDFGMIRFNGRRPSQQQSFFAQQIGRTIPFQFSEVKHAQGNWNVAGRLREHGQQAWSRKVHLMLFASPHH
jgi:hypothetical protein